MTTSSATQAKALQLTRELAAWQERHHHPFSFYTEASIDLADRPELLAAMVEANFMYVFIGIETPSSDALKESQKFQNLRKDNLSADSHHPGKRAVGAGRLHRRLRFR